jgi:hypothetical protein
MPADRGQTADRLRDYHLHRRLRDRCVGRLGVLGVPDRAQIRRRYRYRCVLDLDLVLQIHVRAAGTARQTAAPSCAADTAGWVANGVVQAGAQSALVVRTWAPRGR